MSKALQRAGMEGRKPYFCEVNVRIVINSGTLSIESLEQQRFGRKSTRSI
jgi:hypothetical protein